MSSNPIYKATATGPEPFNMTLQEFCDEYGEEIDIVICQLFENCAAPTDMTADNQSDRSQMQFAADYLNLYREFHNRMPNARRYQFNGFLGAGTPGGLSKRKAISAAARKAGVETIEPYMILSNDFNTSYTPATAGSDYDVYARAGDKIYDADGTQIATVSSIVAGHPNDYGFAYMAAAVIDCLFNANTAAQYQNRGVFALRKHDDIELYFTKPAYTEFFNVNNITTKDSDGNYIGFKGYISMINNLWNHILLPGIYRATYAPLGGSAMHGTLYVNASEPAASTINRNQKYNMVYDAAEGEDTDVAKTVGIYVATTQEWKSENENSDCTVYTMYRRTILAANMMQFRDLRWNNHHMIEGSSNLILTNKIYGNRPVYKTTYTVTKNNTGTKEDGKIVHSSANSYKINNILDSHIIGVIASTGAVLINPLSRVSDLYIQASTHDLACNLGGEANNTYYITVEFTIDDDAQSL